MRADYRLYAVAIICFIIAALPYYYTSVFPEKSLTLDYFQSTALTVIFAALGLISIILGYSQRPKPIISIPEAPQPTPPPLPQSTEETTTPPLSEPTPTTTPQEETAEPEKKKPKTRTRRKGTRRRRKKT